MYLLWLKPAYAAQIMHDVNDDAALQNVSPSPALPSPANASTPVCCCCYRMFQIRLNQFLYTCCYTGPSYAGTKSNTLLLHAYTATGAACATGLCMKTSSIEDAEQNTCTSI
jgi:hypothetical protein